MKTLTFSGIPIPSDGEEFSLVVRGLPDGQIAIWHSSSETITFTIVGTTDDCHVTATFTEPTP